MVSRSLLFIPGNNTKFLQKSRNIQVDILCFDLEDSVPPKEKNKARQLIKKTLKSYDHHEQQIFIRVNNVHSDYIYDDLTVLNNNIIDGIVIPKINEASELHKMIKIINDLQQTTPIKLIPSIESTTGVVNSYRIASSSKLVYSIMFGIFDFLEDLGVEYKKLDTAMYARSKVPIDAKAAGIFAIDSIWQDLNDNIGLRNDCIIGKNLGYTGKSIIHPNQIDVVHNIFRPSKSEINWAKKICTNYRISIKKGYGAMKLDNKMIDEVHYKRALSILKLIDDE